VYSGITMSPDSGQLVLGGDRPSRGFDAGGGLPLKSERSTTQGKLMADRNHSSLHPDSRNLGVETPVRDTLRIGTASLLVSTNPALNPHRYYARPGSLPRSNPLHPLGLAVRQPTNRACRNFLSRVHSTNCTSATSSGRTHTTHSFIISAVSPSPHRRERPPDIVE
jgi:hypothetical protein